MSGYTLYGKSIVQERFLISFKNKIKSYTFADVNNRLVEARGRFPLL